ncbi:MAG: hypothetical protein HY075_05250, partial [Deltaproteobacteria bacterium]|nr:hypothetical protein [Deltaproteobacteria bacterium]
MAARNPSLKAFLLALVVLGAGCGQKSEPYDPLKFMVWGGQSDYNNPLSILFHDLPGGRPIDSFDRLVALKLLDHRLTLPDERLPWPSEFFPTWFGGVSGRWQDPKVLLLLRSLTGFDPPSPADAHALVDAVDRGDQAAAARLYRLAPTEKYDLAVGDYDFHVSRAESLIRGHNRPEMLLATPFWMGYCNGAALAALRFREPVREVDVVSSDGHAIRFHPNDVKALLALSHTQAEFAHWQIGRRCDRYTTSTPECNDVNPATLVIALTNRIGLRKSGFVIDTNPLAPVINMAVRSTFVSVLRPPYRVLAPDPIKYVVDVAIGIEGASTLISSSAADRPDPSRGEGYFRPV